MQMLFRQVNKFLQCRHNKLSIDNTVLSEIHAGLKNITTVFLLKGLNLTQYFVIYNDKTIYFFPRPLTLTLEFYC